MFVPSIPYVKTDECTSCTASPQPDVCPVGAISSEEHVPDETSRKSYNSEDANKGQDHTFLIQHSRDHRRDEARLTSRSVDLLEEIRAALDTLEPLLIGRTVDIEMSRLRVLADPMLFRRVFAERIASALARSEPSDAITVRVTRTGKAARIEVTNEGGHVAGNDLPDLGAAGEEFRAMGGEIGTAGPVGDVICWMTLALAPGASSAADA